MTRLIPVIGHTRHLPDKPRLIDNAVHQRLWNEFLGNVLAMELESALSEPLEGLDMPEWQKQQIRETGF